jgi:hypothetical protein
MENELIARIKSETPVWFKRIRKISVRVSAICVSLLGASIAIPGFVLPATVSTACTYIVVAGITAGCVSTTAKVDQP